MKKKYIHILGEGNTPIIRSKYIAKELGIKNLWLKNEGLNPSGSFKDRESVYVFNRLKRQNVKKSVSIASSGNAAISACLYGKHFDVEVHCIVSEKIAQEKRELIQLLGGILHVIPGYYKESYEWLVQNPISNAINITSGQYYGRELGNVPLLNEIYSDGVLADIIVMPVGNGSLLSGVFKGLEKLKKEGCIKKYPQLIGVEVMNFAPVAEAIRQGRDSIEIKERPISIADAGMAAQKAYCSEKCIAALKATNGKIVEIEEESILPALYDLLQEGIFVEPSSACVIAALRKLNKERCLPDGNIVSILTGSGQKMSKKLLKITTT